MVAKQLTAVLIGMTVLTLASAEAQTEWDGTGFISLNGGGQFGDRQFSRQLSLPKFDEMAEYEIDHASSGGGILDIAAALRLWRSFGIGVGFTLLQNTESSTGRGTVPNPLFFDRARTVTFEETGVKSTEVGIHFSGVYGIPLTDRLQVTVFGGPTILRLRHDLVSNVGIGPEIDPPFFDTVTVTSVSTMSASKTGLGGHIGFDATLLLNDQLGVGGIFRFVGGSVDLPAGDTTVSVDIGGAQVGGGLRLFF